MIQKKAKVLYLSHSPYLNGAEISLLTLLRNINRDLFEPIVIFPCRGPLSVEMRKLGIKYYISPLERWIRYTSEKPDRTHPLQLRCGMIMDIIESEEIDIVHTNTAVIFEGALAAKIKGIPHMWHVHEFLSGHPELNPALPLPVIYRVMSFLSHKIVCVSDLAKSQFSQNVEDRKLVIVYNGVDRPNIQGDDVTSEDDMKAIQTGLPIAITVGMLTLRKGYPMWLEAIANIKEKGYKAKFIWVGGASEECYRDFRKRIKQSGLEEVVSYLGFRKDPQIFLKNADLLICSSNNEAFPLVILEGMAAGLPVVTSDWGGASECVVDGQTGYIVPANNATLLSERIIDMISSESKRRVFGENGYKRYIEKFTGKGFARHFETLYEGLLCSERSDHTLSNDKVFIDSLCETYEMVSSAHWKLLRRNEKRFLSRWLLRFGR